MIHLIIALFSVSVFSKSLDVVSKPYEPFNREIMRAIMKQFGPYGKFSPKSEIEEKKPETLSRGQQIIEEAKAKNRAAIAQQKEKTPEKLEGLDAWKAEVKKTHEGWKKEIQDQRLIWQKEQENFLRNIKDYQASTFEIPAPKIKIVEKKVTLSDIPEYHVVNAAFEVPVKDQGPRATCSAFAGVRALEIILAQNGINQSLSEQYFYWASKPKCQKLPCSEKGSWITTGLSYSQKQAFPDIPKTEMCPYSPVIDASNETQLPLKPTCLSGGAKVEKYEEIKTLSEVIEKIKKDIPVIMAAKLTPNFYLNQGLVTLEDSTKKIANMNHHSMGHAFLAVGVVELPEKLRAKEGNYCLIVANSWGNGWGTGGHSCLTENWLLKFRQPSPFLTVTSVGMRN